MLPASVSASTRSRVRNAEKLHRQWVYSGVPAAWPVRPWLFVPEAHAERLKGGLASLRTAKYRCGNAHKVTLC